MFNTIEDINEIIILFVIAAKRAKEAGFDGVQVHLAYSWLLNRFINLKYNHRTDTYGGSPENRIRIAGEVVKAIHETIPDFFVMTKISFYYNDLGEFDIDDCVVMCKLLEQYGIDAIEVCGQKSPVGIKKENEAYFLELAKSVQEVVKIPVVLVGGIEI